MKFLADENFPRPAILVLRHAGFDVRSLAEECPGSTDLQVAELCVRDEVALLTFDKDFGELVYRQRLRAGSAIVLFRLVPETPLGIVAVSRSLLDTRALVAGVFCVVTPNKVRTRPLQRRADS